VKGISIVATEEEMYKSWDTQFTNWCEPFAMAQLLEIFYQGKHLSKPSSAFLKKLMTETTTGLKRIKGLLPEGTIVIHKTGTSDTNEKGITAATNDAGIVTLPNGKHFAIVVFVTNSPENQDTRERVIAEISKALWDYYITRH
jgi:beta-lactamase class A